jgi:RimJ/RimL family protein N-acetyltransferase
MNSALQSGNLFTGDLVRLAALDPDRDLETVARWFGDTEFARLLDSDPARPRTARQEKQDLEKRLERENGFNFAIRTLADDRLIGFVSLWTGTWTNGEGWVGIGLGERDFWGKGYGSDAMRLIVRYAFHELNLARVSLEAFGYNRRAIRAYEKVGFQLEGVQRQCTRRDGQLWDAVGMGILRTDWENRV